MAWLACPAAGLGLKHSMKQGCRSGSYRSSQKDSKAGGIFARIPQCGNGLRPVLPQEWPWDEWLRGDHSAIGLVLAVSDGRRCDAELCDVHRHALRRAAHHLWAHARSGYNRPTLNGGSSRVACVRCREGLCAKHHRSYTGEGITRATSAKTADGMQTPKDPMSALAPEPLPRYSSIRVLQQAGSPAYEEHFIRSTLNI